MTSWPALDTVISPVDFSRMEIIPCELLLVGFCVLYQAMAISTGPWHHL